MKFKPLLLTAALPLALTACGNAKEDEAKRLGFSSYSELEDIHSKGWHTRAQYLADETERAKRLGFINMDELHDAETAGIMDPAAYRKHKAEEDARLAAEEAKGDSEKEDAPVADDPPAADPPAPAADAAEDAGVVIQSQLNAPDSYEFVGGKTVWSGKDRKGQTAYVVLVSYNAQNGFGAKLRACSWVAYAVTKNDKISWSRSSGIQSAEREFCESEGGSIDGLIQSQGKSLAEINFK
jgi:putative hemolysin